MNPHEKEGTQRTPPIAPLESAQRGQETETLVGRGVQKKGGTVVVSDRAKKATLARLLGMDAMVVVMPQEQLTKIVRRNTHRGNRRRTPQEGVVRTRQQGCTPRGTHRVRKLPQGEGTPGSQPRKEHGQEEGSYSPGRESQQGQTNQPQGGHDREGASPRGGEQPHGSCKGRKRAWVFGSGGSRMQGE